MSSRRAPVGPRARGANNRSGQGIRLKQQPSMQQRSAFAETKERSERLRAQNETLRNQNMELARELNDLKSKLQISRQRERESGRRLIQRDRSCQDGGAPPAFPSAVDAHSRSSLQRSQRGTQRGWCKESGGTSNSHGDQERRGVGGDQIEDDLGLRNPDYELKSGNLATENGAASFGERRTAEFCPSGYAPASPSPAVRSAKEVHQFEAVVPVVPRKGGRRSSILPKSLIDLHSGQHRKPATSVETDGRLAAPSTRPSIKNEVSRSLDLGGKQKEAECLPEEEVLGMDPKKGVEDELCGTPSEPKTPVSGASQCCSPSTPYPGSSSNWSPADYPTQGSVRASPTKSTETASLAERVGSRSTPTGSRGETSRGAVQITQTEMPAALPSASVRSSKTAPLAGTSQPSTVRWPRRDVSRPLSYQEPSLNTKMRKGHVMFPKAKPRIQRTDNPSGGREEEKENVGERDHKGGDEKR